MTATAATLAPKDDNRPPLTTADQLSKDFAHIEQAIAAALVTASEVPNVIEDEEDIGIARAAVRGLLNESKRAEANREETKAPYLDAGRVVDSFFNALKVRCSTAQSAIEASSKRYLDAKAAREKAAREEEARIAREAERKRQEEAAAAARAAAEQQRKVREAEEAAQREADAERRAEADRVTAAARAEAEKRDAAARAARDAEITAAAAASSAQRAVDEKPADLARTRTGTGVATLAQGYEFEITDLGAIDLEALRPHIGRPDLEKAVRAFVKTHKDTVPLRGVRIFPTTNARFT